MCTMFGNCGQCGRCGNYGGCGSYTRTVCRDRAGNLWVRVADDGCGRNTCGNTSCFACSTTSGCGNSNTGTGCMDGDRYYARQYALNGNTCSCGCNG